MKVTNNCKSPLGIPGNQMLEPNESRVITNWDEVKSNRVVQSWLNRGMLIAGESEDAKGSGGNSNQSDNNPGGEDTERKDELIAELKELNVNRDRRAKVETLEKLLEEAKEKAASDADDNNPGGEDS